MKSLFAAVRQGDLTAVARSLDRRADLIASVATAPPQKEVGQSLLQVALRTGHLDVALLLIERGADLDFIEAVGTSPRRQPVLHDAVTVAVWNVRRWERREGPPDQTGTSDGADLAFDVLRRMIERGADVHAVRPMAEGADFSLIDTAAFQVPGVVHDIEVPDPDRDADLGRIFGLLRARGVGTALANGGGTWARPDAPGRLIQQYVVETFLS